MSKRKQSGALIYSDSDDSDTGADLDEVCMVTELHLIIRFMCLLKTI